MKIILSNGVVINPQYITFITNIENMGSFVSFKIGMVGADIPILVAKNIDYNPELIDYSKDEKGKIINDFEQHRKYIIALMPVK